MELKFRKKRKLELTVVKGGKANTKTVKKAEVKTGGLRRNVKADKTETKPAAKIGGLKRNVKADKTDKTGGLKRNVNTAKVGRGNKKVADHKIIETIKAWKLKSNERVDVARYMLCFGMCDLPETIGVKKASWLKRMRNAHKRKLASFAMTFKTVGAVSDVGDCVVFHNKTADMLGSSETMKGHTGATLSKWANVEKGELRKLKIPNAFLSLKDKKSVMNYLKENTALTRAIETLTVATV